MSGRFSRSEMKPTMRGCLSGSQSLRMSGRFSPTEVSYSRSSVGGRNPFVCQVDSVHNQHGANNSLVGRQSQSLRMSGRFSQVVIKEVYPRLSDGRNPFVCQVDSVRSPIGSIRGLRSPVAIPSYVRSIQSAAFFLPAFSRTLACFCADLKTILLKSIAITSFGVE